MKRTFEVFFKTISFISVIIALVSTLIFAQNSAQNLTKAQWQADVKFLGEELPKRHRNLFHKLKREDFETAIKTFHDNVPKMTKEEIMVNFLRIAAMVKDGHTSIGSRQFTQGEVYPMQLFLFADGLFILKASPEYSEMVGGRIVKIGNLNVDEVMEKVGKLAATDNEWGVKDVVPFYLSIPEILVGLKIINNRQDLKLTVSLGGIEKNFDIKPTAKFDEILNPPAEWKAMNANASNPLPLYLKKQNDLYWFEYLKEQKTVYVQHNGIANKENESVADFYKRVMRFVEANPIEKFVIDLRLNGGGNNELNRPVVIELIKSKINESGKLFVIIGRQTFSAAQNFVNEIEKYTKATFVGEPTSANPNHFGDAMAFALPNSKVTVRASTLWWQDLPERDKRPFTAPEIAAEASSEDYRKNIDPPMEAIFNYKTGTTYADLVAEATTNSDLSGFTKKYRQFKANPQHRFINTESQMNQFGYFLLNNKKVSEAIEIFKLNVEYYPNSANVYDSLGDALQAAGKKEEAIKSYEKALSIDPNYPSSLESLRKLKGK